MCVVSIEKTSDCSEIPSAAASVEEKDDWLMSVPGVKALLARLNGVGDQPKKEEDKEELWMVQAKVMMLVDEAFEQLTTASGGLMAFLTGRTTNTNNMKAIEGEEESNKMPLVTWELPSLSIGVKQDLLAWSSVRAFWEKTLSGKSTTQDLSVSYTEMDPTDGSEADGLFVVEPVKQDPSRNGDTDSSTVDVAQSNVENTKTEYQKDVYEEVGLIANGTKVKDEMRCENHCNGTPDLVVPEDQVESP